jgi:hypothetical protein
MGAMRAVDDPVRALPEVVVAPAPCTDPDGAARRRRGIPTAA